MNRSNRFERLILSTIGAGLVLTMSIPALAQSARTSDACTRISPAVLDSYANEIGAALRWATADASKNGATGQYAVAATNSRDLLERAHQKAISGAADLRNADPSVTTFGEAGQTKEHVRDILEVVPQAAHWSIISSIYHNSADADNAFEGAIDVLQRGNALFADAGRCYMGLSSEQTGSSSSQSEVPAPLFHFPLDTPDVDGDAKLYVKKGNAAPTAVPGPTGKALHFTGAAAVAAPFNLDSAQYPQTTVTAWVKRDGQSGGSRSILSGGDGAGILLGVNSKSFTVKAGPTGVSFNEKMPTDEWVFVAAVVDTANGWARLHQNNGVYLKDNIEKTGKSKSPKLYANPVDPNADREAYLFVGASQFRSWGRSEASLAIDDVRVYAGALTVDQVNAIRRESTPAAIGETEKNGRTQLPVGSLPGVDTGGTRTESAGTSSCVNASTAIARGELSADGAFPDVCQTPLTGGQAAEDSTTTDILQDRVGESVAPDITYGSEEEAQRRADAEAQAAADRLADEQGQATGGYALSSSTQRTGVAGLPGTTSMPIDLIDEAIESIQLLYPVGNDRGGPIEVSIEGRSGRTVSTGSGAGLPAKISVGRDSAMIGTIRACFRRDTLLGLQIEGNDLDDDGKFGEYFKIADQLGNCKWLERSRCRDLNAAATGVAVHMYKNPKYDKKQVVGIQLICRLVVPS